MRATIGRRRGHVSAVAASAPSVYGLPGRWQNRLTRTQPGSPVHPAAAIAHTAAPVPRWGPRLPVSVGPSPRQAGSSLRRPHYPTLARPTPQESTSQLAVCRPPTGSAVLAQLKQAQPASPAATTRRRLPFALPPAATYTRPSRSRTISPGRSCDGRQVH